MKKMVGIVLLIAVIALTGCSHGTITEEQEKTARTYDCDYHTLSVRTCISYEKDGDEYEISGDLIRFVTDPLQLKKNGEIIGKADDTYHVVGQDDHAIVINGNFEIDIQGNFEVLGNSYELYGSDKEKVGYAEFGTLCLDGAVYTVNDDVVAEYSRRPFMNDYSVTIYDNDLCSDEAILMIIASYVSDYHEDKK